MAIRRTSLVIADARVDSAASGVCLRVALQFEHEVLLSRPCDFACRFALRRTKPGSQPEPKSVTVPATIDHNRVVIDVDLPLPNGATERVRAWVDNGNPDLYLSRRLATLLGLTVTCDDQECSAPPPPEIDDRRNDDSALGREAGEDSAEAGECRVGAGAGHECGDQSSRPASCGTMTC